jgi:protein-S-isoprenylcysteine O-methyltransferase Ste14
MKKLPLWAATIAGMILVPVIPEILIPWLIISATTPKPFKHFGIPQGIGLLFVLAGIYLMVWVVYAFFRWGKGTPAPFNPPQQFVRRGLYKYSRNPMYLGAVLIWMGEALFFLSVWILAFGAFMTLVLHLFLTFYEEPDLTKRFGKPYLEYCDQTPRWLPIKFH